MQFRLKNDLDGLEYPDCQGLFFIKSLFVAIWQQFLEILKVEKSLILRAFRGTKSDIKFEFYEET